MTFMRTSLSLLLLSLILAACGQQAAPPTPIDVDMSVRAEPESLAVGEAALLVTLKDADGSPIDGARLQVHGDMDHEGMTPVDREVSESTNGEYRVPFEWTMGGGWIVTVTAQLPGGGEITQTFDFFVEAVSSESVINRGGRSDDTTVNIAYQSAHDPAVAGDGTITITLTSADGSPISDAVVEVTGDMAHEGMMPVSGTGAHVEDGQYAVPLRWTMAGDWQLAVKVTLADGRQFERVFDQQVVMP
ncbi:MAG: FixH family protein [Anaerolineae bacterium]|nr:FixH family protein [Anaerolineae bacterium]